MTSRPRHAEMSGTIRLPKSGNGQGWHGPVSSWIAPLNPPHEHVRLGSRLREAGSRMGSN